jgi:hypothetical protein
MPLQIYLTSPGFGSVPSECPAAVAGLFYWPRSAKVAFALIIFVLILF